MVESTTQGAPKEESFHSKAIRLVACFFGLQISFVTWGVMQESLMTTEFTNGGRFPSSVFPVFSDRCVACVLAWCIVQRKRASGELKDTDKAPAWIFSPSACSNVMSSWAQYDALKYVTFPVQTLFKSSKVIPVMLMGKLLHGKSYGIVEYIEAIFITAGIALFTLLNGSSGHGQGETQSVGVMILLVYVVADSFTSQWQHRIYAKFTIDSFQMMLGMNLYSLAFTGASLLQSGSGAQAIAFLKANPAAVMNLAMLSTASATGQMFIFYTIKTFGPIIFTIIMITRQMISMGVSCVLFGHALVPISLIGAATVFATLFHRAKRSYTASERKKAAAITPAGHDSKPLIAVNQSFNLKSLEEAQDHTKGGNSPGSR
eukprot:g7349.t1